MRQARWPLPAQQLWLFELVHTAQRESTSVIPHHSCVIE
jgi:hypothetical protein